ncbi:MAG: galactose-1-phosphate uridylyltransferase [Candidatus Omnitrophota bacterium]|nr:galactose-1-phosphate uridylyltransferase [Candidatus Omnitrophota bacterium]MBU1929430.1 galactose-1-phosphate uridylyltransferase [Candidatus Omnitrophota bacterium]MBU2034846.1 galactose-1-phosphate uridylyltransferase [Candidatus Omnitrophota bacterium]MBU2221932.1 galactose-1-phosphate uridylyltransferase [Candidatus Omnitrophota bacterium]MBU2257917.1 galactose-1-phosphate uridylyltransferase [Candidatus Omnitrophota bacterium]
MSELRRDPIGGRWVIVDTDHPNRPKDYDIESPAWREGVCPFCYGNESQTPPEIIAIREPGTAANTPGWQARVVSNKYPALQIEGDLDRSGLGIYDMSNGIGAHEVIIDSPYHQKDIPDLLDQEVENIFSLSCVRSLDLMRDKRFKYVMIFKNYGPAAGASLAHPHTQLIALPMVPKSVKEEINGAHNYFEYRDRCIFCDVIRQETQEKERIVLENKYFLAFCPFVSRFPFEIWVIPKKHNGYFCHMPQEEVPALASMVKELISKVKKIFGSLCYNFIIHSAPINGDGEPEGYHWHLEFMPKLTKVAGFEWGTGFYLVPTPPELAAKFLREENTS